MAAKKRKKASKVRGPATKKAASKNPRPSRHQARERDLRELSGALSQDRLAKNLRKRRVQQAVGVVLGEVVLPFLAGFLRRHEDEIREALFGEDDDDDDVMIPVGPAPGPRARAVLFVEGAPPTAPSLLEVGPPPCNCPRCSAKRAKEAN